VVVDGDAKGGVDALKRVADHDAAIPLDFGPPDVPKPPLELLGDVLLENGMPEAALNAYRKSLARTPGRTLAVRGVERSTTAVGAVAARAMSTDGQSPPSRPK
jgi:hypothetical protein